LYSPHSELVVSEAARSSRIGSPRSFGDLATHFKAILIHLGIGELRVAVVERIDDGALGRVGRGNANDQIGKLMQLIHVVDIESRI